eukprot:200558_1
MFLSADGTMSVFPEQKELDELRQENQLLNKRLTEQYAINQELQKKLKKAKNAISAVYELYPFDSSDQSELEPLSLAINHENHEAAASTVNLAHKIKGGAVTFNVGNFKTRIYLHYWIWQVPVIIVNIILCIILFSKHNIGTELGFLAVGPVLLSALVRDKMFLWVVYWCVKHFYCCSQYGRYHFSRLVDCIGGLHASFGVTALIWNVVYCYDVFIHENNQFNGISITAFFIPTLLLMICVSAVPCFRYYYHNSFELLHRYLGWLSLSILVVHVSFVTKRLCEESEQTGGILFMLCLINSPTLYTLALVILTMYPWFIIHKIKGSNVEIIPSKSGKTAILIFDVYSPMGAICKMSTNWTEFHVFGITPLPYDKNRPGYRSLVLIKDLGDWSHSLTQAAKNGELQDTNFWIHRIKPPNFSQGLFNWTKVFALATGAGIAPLIPYVLHPNYFHVQISLVWVARDHANNYPELIVDTLRPLENVIMYDTTKQKRLDLSLLTVEKAKEFEAEAVFIVSNPTVAYQVANYVNKKGIPVFASNFDV